ncbi:glycoside hydrolase [Decorospora gaudefroyi]|uniref:glucan endo-1,3-beta-D-glucosidase n=1 Tax=Decorospora gaudefroyi TaxID=184978 RepID=A0A6A5KHX9_9PLEO|nr:glycoside hydrolase [Decorospora gaudefroyi]
MKLLPIYLLLSPCLAQAATKFYTGFNYGAFWGVESNVKKKADFLDGFNLAKNLTTDIPFDSARLFTCKAAGTLDEASGAFDAAVYSRTNLLLGFWITPPQKGASPDENVKHEMAALEKGFKKHGQALSDLVIGLSVGNEDIYRSEDTEEIGVAADVVAKTIDQVKKSIAASSFAQYMKDKPIGHVDTAKHAVVDNADFIGMTAYPYWNKDSIDNAGPSFLGSLDSVKKRAGDRPVWIAEMGWPFADTTQHGAAVAGVNELQRFWTEVGCAVFGKYTTFWFELLKDSTPEQADWGFIDIPSRKPRIKNLSCGAPKQSPSVASSAASQTSHSPTLAAPPKTSSSASDVSQTAAPILSSSLLRSAVEASVSSSFLKSTTHITVTKATTTTIPTPSKSTTHTTVTKATTTTISAPTGSTTHTTVTGTTTTTIPAPSKSTTHTTITGTTTTTIQAPSIPSSGEPVYVTVTVTTTKIGITTTTTLNPTPTPTPTTVSLTWCITVADLDRNGKHVTVAGRYASANGDCTPPSTFSGYPYVTSDPSTQPTPVSVGAPWCVTMVDIDRKSGFVPIDAGPAGPRGDCNVAPTYSGDRAVSVTLTTKHTTPPSSEWMSQPILKTPSAAYTAFPFSSRIPIISSAASHALATATPPPNITLASPSSPRPPYCKRRVLNSATTSSSAAATGSKPVAFTVRPVGPFGVTLPGLASLAPPTAVAAAHGNISARDTRTRGRGKHAWRWLFF